MKCFKANRLNPKPESEEIEKEHLEITEEPEDLSGFKPQDEEGRKIFPWPKSFAEIVSWLGKMKASFLPGFGVTWYLTLK